MVYVRHLIIGHGEIGKSMVKVLKESPKNLVYWKTRTEGNYKGQSIDVIHICIPCKDKDAFIKTVEFYKYTFANALIIVHSSVPIGTCDELHVVHSPVRGVHPHLARGIKTFVKYFGGIDIRETKKASLIFKNLGIKVKVLPDARTTEALKLWDTTQYGRLIMLEKEIYKWCEENKIDFDFIYKTANKDYNNGYTKLGRPEVVRPYLKHIEGPIGGHCVLPNAKLLKVKL